MAHSLGSVLMWDILCNQPHLSAALHDLPPSLSPMPWASRASPQRVCTPSPQHAGAVNHARLLTKSNTPALPVFPRVPSVYAIQLHSAIAMIIMVHVPFPSDKLWHRTSCGVY